MSVQHIRTTSFTRIDGGVCPACDDPPHSAFNWTYALEHKDSAVHKFTENLKPLKALKFGQLYECRICAANWVLDHAGSTMTRVMNAHRALLAEWSSIRLDIAPDHLQVLQDIGATSPKHWMGKDIVISIPCAIVLGSGETVDPAIVWITRRPPVFGFPPLARLYRDVAAVGLSRFALPMKVRRATIKAPEIRMGYSPTLVKAPDGTKFILHWATSVFHEDGIPGSELRLPFRRVRADDRYPDARSDSELATFFFADWFPGCEKLDRN